MGCASRHTLLPFSPAPAGVGVVAEVAREGAHLMVTWRLTAPPGVLSLPMPVASPARRDGLWEATCFEFFLRAAGGAGYWEANLGPTGDWNLYRLSGYRQGLTPEAAVAALPVVRTDEGAMQAEGGAVRVAVATRLDLGALGLGASGVEVAIATVLRLADGTLIYLALCHPALEADFHHPDSFTLRL